MSRSNKELKTIQKVMAARQAKKLAKQKAKSKEPGPSLDESIVQENQPSTSGISRYVKPAEEEMTSQLEAAQQKSEDEVDKAAATPLDIEETEAKEVKAGQVDEACQTEVDVRSSSEDNDMTVKDVLMALVDIKQLALEFKDLGTGVQTVELKGAKAPVKQPASGKKSKSQLKAERRARQEAQRAAKQAATASANAPPMQPAKENAPSTSKSVADDNTAKAMSPKQTSKKGVQQSGSNWFGMEYKDPSETLKNMPVNSNIHPAFVKLSVQLASRVVSGANARCIALLDALKKMTTDYTLPANTEFGRGLDAHLTETVDFLATMRKSTACEINAIKFFRHHLMKLPNNVNEFEAKKTLQEEIDRYVREQIFVAGEAISADVRKKISPNDVILTYGISSTVERCLVDAHAAKIPFRVVVCGSTGTDTDKGSRELARRLRLSGLRVDVVDITAISDVMPTVNKVLLGAVSVLNDGSVLGAVGTAMVALMAKTSNVPVLVACETHKFSERVQTDAFTNNELRNPDDLNAVGNEDWPLKDWRTKPIAILNLAYDVTPPKLVTAVVTELAILPCTSAPVVLRFRAAAYGI